MRFCFSVVVAFALVNFAAAASLPRAEAAAEGSTETEALVARSGNQYIGGVCLQDSECSSNCCGFSTGKCTSPFVALSSGGCGYGSD
ncbi:hypothetical protein GSI_10905 [Ganoderma sinense ZZ0214-1]|uniref:Biotrophy-associated secreted protein 2 n=1 Tax=Ganoderma sinense ZZ0214-1 TaxID=1077348 RepID=A0A2G8S1W8_9APHY|nr:hypothetical protein GSI_10905 [Ganoderma sinense ZZ0214-1]